MIAKPQHHEKSETKWYQTQNPIFSVGAAPIEIGILKNLEHITLWGCFLARSSVLGLAELVLEVVRDRNVMEEIPLSIGGTSISGTRMAISPLITSSNSVPDGLLFTMANGVGGGGKDFIAAPLYMNHQADAIRVRYKKYTQGVAEADPDFNVGIVLRQSNRAR